MDSDAEKRMLQSQLDTLQLFRAGLIYLDRIELESVLDGRTVDDLMRAMDTILPFVRLMLWGNAPHDPIR